MNVKKVPPPQAVEQLTALLDSPELVALINTLEYVRWTGRPGYPVRAMVGMCLVKSLYELSEWTRTARLVKEHPTLREILGCAPSHWACYRFAKQLRVRDGWALTVCIDRVLAGLRKQFPEMGKTIAIDGSAMPAYANGHRRKFKSRVEHKPEGYSDPDASWGHRSAVSTRKGGPYYGYKLHAAVDTATDLPIAWTVQTAKDSEHNFPLVLIDKAKDRGFHVQTAIMDKGYDSDSLHFWAMRRDVTPIIAIKQTAAVKKGGTEPPHCVHGAWSFAGADYERKATQWRCPTGECSPASVWIKADRLHPLVPRDSERHKALYRKRGSAERAFGRLKHDWGLLPLRVRRLDRVQLHAELTILAQLSCALARSRAQAVPLAA